jgi:peptidoglycan/LPS O-acetylase OafA/YrhL
MVRSQAALAPSFGHDSPGATGFNHRLDIMRGLAALCVAFHHAEAHFLTGSVFVEAYLAVDFFFLLSGYVIGRSYERRFVQGLAGLEFMRRRIVRLWPVIAIGLALGAMFHFAEGMPFEAVSMSLVAQFCFIPIFVGSTGIFPFNGVQWSLWFELQANLFHATLLWRMPRRALILLLCVLGVLLVGACLIVGKVGFGDTGENWWGGYARAGFSYGLGSLIARSDGPLLPPALHRLAIRVQAGRLAPFGLLLVLIGAGLLAPLGKATVDLIAVFLLFPLLLLLATTEASSLTSTADASFLGRISYPLYAVHVPLITFVAARVGPAAPAIRLASASATLLAAILLATFIWQWFDQRAIRVSRPSFA